METSSHVSLSDELKSLDNEGSNAIILPQKKKNKKIEKRKKRQLKDKSKSRLSNSQSRKIKKLEDEKEKAILLSESIKTLQKYKVDETVYSLMWSSRNLGQVETVREKRRREMEFSKVGLSMPYMSQTFKKRKTELRPSDLENEQDASELKLAVHHGEALQSSRGSQDSGRDRAICSKSFEQPVDSNGLCASIRDAEELSMEEGANVTRELSGEESLITSASRNSGSSDDFSRSKDLEKNMKIGLSSACNLGTALPSLPSAPTVVYVLRPKEVELKRRDLPIVMMEQEIMEAINENICVIICGETGCGKTTQVPQFLYEAGFGSNLSNDHGGVIGVTQPRRVAVLSTAKRVAYELGLHLGKEVGFQVRHDRRIGRNSSIKFMTDGILLRELQNDFLLRRYSIIILDEAHERSLNTDILIGMLSRIIRVRQIEYEEQQRRILDGGLVSPENKIYPLKLVLMSATLRVEDFLSGGRIFLNPPPIIEVPTRQYPVTVHFSKRTEIVDYIGQAYKKVLSIHKKLPPGGILVFVTGQREVEFLCRKLRKASKEMTEKAERANDETSLETGEKEYLDCDMKEINEAFDVHGSTGSQETYHFSSFDDDPVGLPEDESMSDESEDDSDLEVYSDDGDSNSHKPVASESNRSLDVSEDANFASLKEAFEALAGRKNKSPHSEGEENVVKSLETSSDPCSSVTADGKDASKHLAGPMCVLPLYAMLPASAQLQVFDEVKEGHRLVVVATNVAETSLTIPGITYVVDTGREKVKKYNSSNGIETYEVQWISKASAAQRSGRAGRTGPGHCYRLYSSAVFNNIFPDFPVAEISKVPVDGVVLLMKSMNIDKVINFPFPTPPQTTALLEAERCLKILEALDSKGRLTPLGKVMAQYPMSPRHSRMLLTVIQIMQKVKDYDRANLIMSYAIAAAAALSLSNPFVMQFEGNETNKFDLNHEDNSGPVEADSIMENEEKSRKKKQKEMFKRSRAIFSNPTSDALTIAYALQCFELSGSSMDFCFNNALHFKTMEEMSKLRKQLLQLVFSQKPSDPLEEFAWTHGNMDDVERAWRVSSDNHPLRGNEEEILGQAICAGWADRVAKRSKRDVGLSENDRKVNATRYQACGIEETVFLHRWSSVSRSAPEFLVYSELLHTKRPYIHGATSVKANWLVRYARSMCTFSTPLSDPKPYYDSPVDQVFCWVIPTFGPRLWQLPLHSWPIEDAETRVAVFAYALLEGQVLPCLKSVKKYMAALPASILRPEASGIKRVGNLLCKLKTRGKIVDTCAALQKLWANNPKELYIEILDWFQEGFRDKFEVLWETMLGEARLDPKERFSQRSERGKRKFYRQT